tara:strand:+ start:557 stop:1723 length:1167 start_codon:yes stop_codon:yes gene_type:complete
MSQSMPIGSGSMVPYGGQHIYTGTASPASRWATAKGIGGAFLKGTSAYFTADALKPYLTDPLGDYLGSELAQGALTVMGATAEQKAMAAGLPVVRSVNSTDFNISTPEGKKAYEKALKENKPTSADLRGSITPGSMQPAATNLGEGAAFDAAERFRAGKGYPAGVIRPSDYPVQFNPQTEVPQLSLRDQLQQEREALRTGPEIDRMRAWMNAGNNMEMAKRVKPGQAGFEEIKAVLAEKEGGPAASELLNTMYQYDRSAEDARNLLSDKPMSMEWNTDMSVDDQSNVSPLAGRNTMAPAGDFPQYGTQMSGSYASIALPGTPEGLSQLSLTAGQVQIPDAYSKINIDDFYGAGNLVADGLDMERFLPFANIETEPELNRITNLIRRKK